MVAQQNSIHLEAAVTLNPTILAKELIQKFNVSYTTVLREFRRIRKISLVGKRLLHDLCWLLRVIAYTIISRNPFWTGVLLVMRNGSFAKRISRGSSLAQPSRGEPRSKKIMLSVRWDIQVILIINSDSISKQSTLTPSANNFSVWKQLLTESIIHESTERGVIVHYDNARSHIEGLTKKVAKNPP